MGKIEERFNVDKIGYFLDSICEKEEKKAVECQVR
jgi:hypothetical protein